MARLKMRSSLAHRVLFYVGAGSLLLIMGVDSIAVIGRHIGRPFLGAIEIIQAAILIVACAGTVIATLAGAHATVHLLTDRLPSGARTTLARITELMSALLFGALACGTVWLAADFWNAHEESELLHISFRPLRAVVVVAVVVVALCFIYRAKRRDRVEQ